MILKNCITESAEETKRIYENGKVSTATEDLDDYITDPSKTKPEYVGAVNCSPGNFSRISRACRKKYLQQARKQVRHIVISLSPCDNNVDKQKLMDFITNCIAFFGGKYYIKYAIHTNTEHVHAHILICNTAFTDGKQLEFGADELEKFKLFCDDIADKFGLKPINQIDESSDSLEIDEGKFYTRFDVNDIVSYNDSNNKIRYSEPAEAGIMPAYAPAPTIFNIILPPNMKTSIFPRDDGRYMVSSKPMPYSLENGYKPGIGLVEGYFTPQYAGSVNNLCYAQPEYQKLIDAAPALAEEAIQAASSDQEMSIDSGFNIDYFMNNEILVDNETGRVEIHKK